MALKTTTFLVVVLLMEIVCVRSSEETDDIAGADAVWVDVLRNHQLVKHTIRRLHQVTSFIQCGLQCVNLAGCESLNYNPAAGGLCELNGATGGDFPGDLLEGTGDENMVYLDRDSPILMLNESASCPCCKHSCLNGAYCVPAAPSMDPMRHYRCVCDNGWRGDYCEIMEARWSSWSTWSHCSKTCGKGHRRRTRVCQGSNVNSETCDGVESEYQNCWNDAICADWASWEDTAACSSASKCGYGTVNRTRVCQGEGCVGENTEIDRCKSVSCHVPWRLVGGSGQGRLEVYSDVLGEWGTVCSSNWDWEDTVVACRTLGLLPPPLLPEPGRDDVCDPGWLHFEGFCYLVADFEKITFSQAKETCLQQSSHLVSILSEGEDTFVKDFVSNIDKHIWLGAQSVKQGETYKRPLRWLDGSFMTYLGENPHIRNEDWDDDSSEPQCLRMIKNGHWHVRDCSKKEIALCKRQPYFSLRFGPGEGAIHLKDMQCRGCEDHLSQCYHSNWHKMGICDHGQDVGLTCVAACPTYRTDGFTNTRFPFRSVDAGSFRVDVSIQSAGTVRIVLCRSANGTDSVYTITLSGNHLETTLTYPDPSGTLSYTTQQASSDVTLDVTNNRDIWIVGNNGTVSVSSTAAGAPFLEWNGGNDAYSGELYVGFDSTQQAYWKFKSFC